MTDPADPEPAEPSTGAGGGPPAATPPPRMNVLRVLLGLVGLVVGLLVLNFGLNVLSQPGDAPPSPVPASTRPAASRPPATTTIGSPPGSTAGTVPAATAVAPAPTGAAPSPTAG